MATLIFILINVLLIAVGTVILAVALMITGEEGIDRDTLLKCLGIVTTATAVSYIPVVGFMAIVIWFAGLMAVFEKTFGEALLVAVVCWVITFGARLGLGALANMMA